MFARAIAARRQGGPGKAGDSHLIRSKKRAAPNSAKNPPRSDPKTESTSVEGRTLILRSGNSQSWSGIANMTAGDRAGGHVDACFG